jgi:hypothetical protein
MNVHNKRSNRKLAQWISPCNTIIPDHNLGLIPS